MRSCKHAGRSERHAAEAPCPQVVRARPPVCLSARFFLSVLMPVRVFYRRGTGKRHFFDKAAT